MTRPRDGGGPTPRRLAVAGLLRASLTPELRLLAGSDAEGAWAGARASAAAAGRTLTEPREDLASAAAGGARLIIPDDDEWPPALADLASAGSVGPDRRRSATLGVPLGLYVRGNGSLREATERSVALVGARAATSYGVFVAGELAAGLAERAVGVVSGGAFGIDAAAHRGALTASGVTIAVLAGGVDVTYPGAHTHLFEQILRAGLLVSESPPGAPARREQFLVRNRLIAALALGTVMVEAGLRSGARNTFAHAAALGRPRLVVPGLVTSALSAGCHLALRQDPGARLVTSAGEVMEEVGRLGSDLAADVRVESTGRDVLPDTARQLLDAFPSRGEWTLGDIARHLGAGPVAALALAGTLVEGGWLARDGGAYQLTKAARAPNAGSDHRARSRLDTEVTGVVP